MGHLFQGEGVLERNITRYGDVVTPIEKLAGKGAITRKTMDNYAFKVGMSKKNIPCLFMGIPTVDDYR